MAEGIDPGGPAEVLPGGETLGVDGSTVPDPETGRPVPAAVLRLPPWRATEVAAALQLWSRVQALVLTDGAHLPDEATLAGQLSAIGARLNR
jgi:hypothetical protein